MSGAKKAAGSAKAQRRIAFRKLPAPVSQPACQRSRTERRTNPSGARATTYTPRLPESPGADRCTLHASLVAARGESELGAANQTNRGSNKTRTERKRESGGLYVAGTVWPVAAVEATTSVGAPETHALWRPWRVGWAEEQGRGVVVGGGEVPADGRKRR